MRSWCSMPIFRVFYERTEVEYADIEANSAEEAEELTENNYTDYGWSYLDGTINTSILIGETEAL